MSEKTSDSVDNLVCKWAEARPGMDAVALAIAVRIQRIGKLLAQRTNRALKRHGLKHWEYDVLSALRHQGAPFEMPATDLARSVHLTSGAMTTRIDGLEQRRLVERRQHRSDGRSVLVRLTTEGRTSIGLAIATRIDDAALAMSPLPRDERRQLASALRQLLLSLEH